MRFKAFAKQQIEIQSIKKYFKNLDKFDCDVDFFRHTDTHDSAHNAFFRVDVD